MKTYKNTKNIKKTWQKNQGTASGTDSLAKALPFLIFDMDGTLYQFESDEFATSRFNADAKERAYALISNNLKITLDKAKETYQSISKTYNGEVSLGLEKEFGIDRYKYFREVWSPNPSKYIKKASLREFMLPFQGNSAILTAAPRSWAKKVLKYLEIYDLYCNALFTGEPDIRKPDPRAFQQVLDYFKIKPQEAISIGDQENTDIIPAKKIGMRTIIIGKSKEADFEVSSLDELIKVLGELK